MSRRRDRSKKQSIKTPKYSTNTRRVVANNARTPAVRHRLISDNRVFHPLSLPLRPRYTIRATTAPLRAEISRRVGFKNTLLSVPKDAILCARRKIRKEVLFAKKRSGAGNRKPRYNENSKIGCK